MRLFFASLAFVSLAAHAEVPPPATVGLGGTIGTVGAVGLKTWFEDGWGAELNVEYLDHPWSVIYGDVMYHIPGWLSSAGRYFKQGALYIGLGAGIGFWDRLDSCGRWNCHWNSHSTGSGNAMFVRASIGHEWYPTHPHFSIFGEIAPSYMWYPGGASTIDVAVGARYYVSF